MIGAISTHYTCCSCGLLNDNEKVYTIKIRTVLHNDFAKLSLNSTSTSIEAEIALFPFSDTHPPDHPPTRKSTTTNSMSGISQLLLVRFGPNFKGRFLGTSRTDYISYGDICPGYICPGDICPISGISQLLLTQFGPNFRDRLARLSQVQGKAK